MNHPASSQAKVIDFPTAYRVEKGVQMPVKQESRRYPFLDMDVGDSFLVPCKATQRSSKAKQLLTKISAWRKRHGSQYRFATRYMPNGVRVWRIK